MKEAGVSAIVMAGGEGRRMFPISAGKERPKTMIEIGGIPIVKRTILNLKATGISDIVVVVRQDDELSLNALGTMARIVCQRKEERGTAKAAEVGLKVVASLPGKRILIANGDDSGLLLPSTYRELIDFHLMTEADCTTLTLPVRKEFAKNSERKEAFWGNSSLALNARNLSLIYTGVMVARLSWLTFFLSQVRQDELSGEFKITKIFSLARNKSNINTFFLRNPNEWNSFNTPQEYYQMVEKARSF